MLNPKTFLSRMLPVLFLAAGCLAAGMGRAAEKPTPTFFVFGGDIHPKLVRYVAELVDKPDPRICYVPTASGDRAENLAFWNSICRQLSIKPYVMKVWSTDSLQDFEKLLLGMDAIVVGGGNTLNMLGIWKYQGIDRILEKALDRGIVLAGGSAGSICWFRDGVSDSRPGGFSVVPGLGLLPYSHCPHYADSVRRSLYHRLVRSGGMKAGYACDELAGILFKDGRVADVVSVNETHGAYFVDRYRGEVRVRPLQTRLLVKKGALSPGEYGKDTVGRFLSELPPAPSLETPLEAFAAVQRLFADGKHSLYRDYAAHAIRERVRDMQDIPVSAEKKAALLSTKVVSVLTYADRVAAVLTQAPDYYGLWYFYREGGQWRCAGEDLGGDTSTEAEITFRERAKSLLPYVRTDMSGKK